MRSGTRHLAAIMFTDLVGFTRLGQRDEEEALRLRREHQALLRPLFAAHGGREVKTLGDGFLVEFASAVESVRCAVEIQRAVTERNSRSTSGASILLRIGIHVGDVVEEGGDILGDAVNVASRIEPLADPGGVCVSGPVFDQVRNKLPVPLEKLGARTLKNVELPVEVYRVVIAGGARTPPPAPVGAGSNLRVAVLPLANLSVDPGDEYFADGLTDELISRTAQLPEVRVIARTSVLPYKRSPKSIREVGQELGVALALEGSVRKAGRHVRITVQLVDTRSEEHLWSSRYDRPLDDIFAIQDDIAGQIATSISAHVSGRSSAKTRESTAASLGTQDMEAYSEFLHARQLVGEKGSEESIRLALSLYESAVRRDPGFARARVGIADVLLWLMEDGLVPHVEASERAEAELAKALGQNEAIAEAHSVLASLYLGADRARDAAREAHRAMELNPSLADPYRWLAQIAAGNGDIEEAVRLLETGRELDPVDVNITAFLGHAYLYAGRTREAFEFWERTKPIVRYRTNANLTEAYLAQGEYAKAEETVRELERLRPHSAWTITYRAILAARRGDRETAHRALEALDERARSGELTQLFSGFVHFALGEMDEMVACMEEAFRLHSLPLLELMYSPFYAPAREDPRIQDIVRRQHELGTK